MVIPGVNAKVVFHAPMSLTQDEACSQKFKGLCISENRKKLRELRGVFTGQEANLWCS